MATIQQIRQRRIERERMDRGPSEPCCKCGCNAWYKDIDPGIWYCFRCGNTAYLIEGNAYRQRTACTS